MPKKRKPHTLPKALVVTFYVLPFLLPFALWLSLQGQFPAYRPTAADVVALASGFIVLLVFIVQQHLKTASMASRSKESRVEIDRLRGQIKKLSTQPREPKHTPATPTPRTKTLLPEKPKQGIFSECAPSTSPVEDPRSSVEEPIHTPRSQAPDVAEEEILSILKSKFFEYARLSESNADRLTTSLTTSLTTEFPESKNRPKITVIYRDGAVENSQAYRLQREDVHIPKPSIVFIFPSGNAKLFPAPMAGQDCFHDVKAFESNTPAPSQKRSGLTRCEPANLDRDNDNTFQLSQFGKLDFCH